MKTLSEENKENILVTQLVAHDILYEDFIYALRCYEKWNKKKGKDKIKGGNNGKLTTNN